MADMPRIITVDPTGAISRIVRSAMDILDLSIVQIDAPYGSDALEELNRKANLVVTAFDVGDDMKGFELAMRVKKASQETSVLILGDTDDPGEFDEETAQDSPFIYMSRPIDIHRFLRVLVAGLDSHEAMIKAMTTSGTGGGGAGHMIDMGRIPNLDVEASQGIIDTLLTDLGAMAIILSNRSGEVLMERGAVGYIDRERLSGVLTPVMATNMGIKDMVGGNLSSVQLYDGEDYDIFVLTIGLHHVMAIVFDGAQGSRQFGGVIRFGRRAVEDLIAVIGADAFVVEQVRREDALPHRPAPAKKAKEEEEEPVELARAEIAFEEEEEEEEEPAVQLEAISDDEFNLDDLFGAEVDMSEDMFDLDKMEEIAKENAPQRKGAVDWDDAEKLGLLKK